jgi:transcriptional regulator with XRE-family HTH domain
MKTAKTEPETDQVDKATDAQTVDSDAPEHGIGDRIRAAREARGLSQTALAARTQMADATGKGVGRTVLFGYESGKFRPGAREIRLICQALSITPNWLILGDEAASTQASMELVRQRDWIAAVRLAMAISILKPHERAGFQSLVLSLAGRQLGDMKLSALLLTGSMVGRAVMPELKEMFGDDMDDVSLETLMLRCSEGLQTNVGNKLTLDPDEGDIVGGEWLYADPDAKSKVL